MPVTNCPTGTNALFRRVGSHDPSLRSVVSRASTTGEAPPTAISKCSPGSDFEGPAVDRPNRFIPSGVVQSDVTRSVPPAVERLLTSEPLMAHLATCADGRPHVAPVWYVYDDGVVEISTSGRKLRNLRANPRVALSIQKDVDGNPRWTTTLLGTATVVEDEDAFAETNRRINRKYDAPQDAFPRNTLVRIDVGSATYRTYD